MGGASSRTSHPRGQTDSLESRLASLGDLRHLESVFSSLGAPSSSTRTRLVAPLALQECFELQGEYNGCLSSSDISLLKAKVGSTLVDMLYEPDGNGIDWTRFLRGFEKCRHQPVSVQLKFLLSFFFHVRKKADLPLNFTLSNENDDVSNDKKILGHMTATQLQDFLWICWLMGRDANKTEGNLLLELPNLEPLVKAACVSCSVSKENNEPGQAGPLWSTELSVEKLYSWLLLFIPGLSNTVSHYIKARLSETAFKLQDQSMAQGDDREYALKPDITESSAGVPERGLLTPGVAWAVGLSLPDTVGGKLVMCSYSLKNDFPCLLYRSSMHGKGMNRFWTHVEGYRGTVVMLIKGISLPNTEEHRAPSLGEERWLVGVLVREGFENKDFYYGTAGCCLFALDPMMQPFQSSGKSSNYVYSHSHVAGSTYTVREQQILNGIAFGGDTGKERLWLDEDFTQLTVRHHAMDMTYKAGHLLPDQGYAPMKGKVLEVEVWGLGGKVIQEKQSNFQQRKSLFSEQKRKVDLKSFGNWADSPEKMMLDLVSDPNKGQQEEQ